jgi:hypothetical protein
MAGKIPLTNIKFSGRQSFVQPDQGDKQIKEQRRTESEVNVKSLPQERILSLTSVSFTNRVF